MEENARRQADESAIPRWDVQPIGILNSAFKEKNGTPRQPSVCPGATATLKINKNFFNNPNHALDGLQGFSHVWLLFIFHKNSKGSGRKSKVAMPRLDGRRVGVFSTRSPHRPNPVGLTLARLVSVEGDVLVLSGVDIVDGTPVIDIKPYIPEYDTPYKDKGETLPVLVEGDQRFSVKANEMEEMRQKKSEADILLPDWLVFPPVKKLAVSFTPRATHQLTLACSAMVESDIGDNSRNADNTKQMLTDILSEDPRSVYRRQSCKDQLYYFSFRCLHLTCWFDDDDRIVEVVKVRLLSEV